MKAKTLMNKIIIVGGLSACLLLGGCGAGQAADATSAESTVAAQESTVTPTESTEATETVSTETAQDEAQLPDGVYTAEFSTDSSMFHVSEACDGKGTLTVKDGVMTIHISLGSKKILNLYPGLAEDAAKEGAVLLEPTTDTVTYSDGMTEEVYGFDVPVPAIGEEFDLALIGTKGKWYDHKVSVKDPVKTGDVEETTDDTDKKEDSSDKETAEKADASKDEKTSDDKKSEGKKLEDLKLEDGTYEFDVTLTGGTGRATVESPAKVEIKDKEATATIIWSSPNYDYMIVDGEKYEPVNKDGNSTFEIPVTVFDTEMEVTADTVAMSTPHEIDYTLNFDSSSMKKAEK